MSLNDVLKVKRLADNINFLRLYFLESQDKYIKMRNEGKDPGIEIVDCILAIFLFEITRATRSNSIYTREQLSYKVLHFFQTLKVAKEVEKEDPEVCRLRRRNEILEDSDEDLVTEEEETEDPLSQLIDTLKLDQAAKNECVNCRMVTKENQNFKTLYKSFIQLIITNL